jgi:hypothetical protein
VTDDVNAHGIHMPAFLFEHKPSVCPFGHDLAPGRVSVGFSPRVCALAREAAAHGGSMGHLRLYCLACEGRGTFVDLPGATLRCPAPGPARRLAVNARPRRSGAATSRTTPGRLRRRVEVIDTSIGSAPGSARVAARLRGAVRHRCGGSDHTKLGATGATQAPPLTQRRAWSESPAIRYLRRRPLSTSGC